MTEVYTHTLSSDFTLTVPVEATFGDIIITCLCLAIVTVLVVDFLFQVAYRP